MAGVDVSIIIPVYNEERILVRALRRIVDHLERIDLSFELVLAENGSTDTTWRLAKDLALSDSRLRAIHLANPDYGHALRSGFKIASGNHMANFSVDFADVDFLVDAISILDRFDLVLGSKYVSNGYDNRPLGRRLGGLLLSRIVQGLFGLAVTDTHGLMVFRRDSVMPHVERCSSRHEIFDTELVVRAHRARLGICELPVRVEEARPSRLGYFKRARRMLLQYAKLRLVLWREGIL